MKENNRETKNSKVKILVVEDSPTQADQLRYALERRGYSVLVASNGRKALGMLNGQRLAIVISDIVMPEMDGYQFCREIKKDENLKDIPVILLTELSEPRDVIAGLECGADYFLMKPYIEEQIISRIQHITANWTLKKSNQVKIGIELFFAGQKYYITSDRLQILNLLISTYEAAVQKNLELQALNRELELRRKEAEYAKLIAEKASMAKSEFLANMSHELRTPLNAIIGFSDMMIQGMAGKLSEQHLEFLKDIRESGDLLLSLINDILDLSKIEAGKMELEFSVFNIENLIERCMVLFKEKAMKHTIELTAEIAPETGLIEADERRMKQVIVNLLSNAVKFTSNGGSVQISARKVKSEQYLVDSKKLFTDDYSLTTDRDFIEISVEDTGIGIRPEDINKLFKPFQRLECPMNYQYDGTGLGLVICKRVVEMHSGRIWVESVVGIGSKFTFIIPMKKVN